MKIRLNIGSGQRRFGTPECPWINIDCQEKWKPDLLADATALPMFADNQVSVVVLHHVLEHFGCGEAGGVLAECKRILAPGTSLLVFVPDMLELMWMWVEGRIDDQVYMTNIYGAYMGDEADRHKWGFTRASLIKTLAEAGFKPVKTFDWRPIEGADIARDRWILGVEAIK